ncbi:tripartite tricarboxylate transporter TctB family protein [Georgenia thermotolerans]|uniref:Tripartite tricarboxylate transporter TctB family protein n=1 Tax=Georgenia thermotolerans TaxID=527326 RepID=A0A7J5USN9_9MICO|nr:tripartite tricarboxylate transporter TctB family protein [Georgenia thermotolerans]KAE8765338.1 tripartite tricarboxylate transporter TctB family protein [Georgenia thermotolerans]
MTSATTTRRVTGRSELGVAALLGVVGAAVLWDALGLHAPYSQSDPIGPRAVPYLVAALLFGTAVVLAVDVLRGGRGEVEGGEDVDLSQPTDWRTVVPLVAVFAANIVLIDTLGWVISGALLFFGSVMALGSRHYVRDALVSLVLALGTFYGFYLGLGIHLPAGLLEGVL